MQYLNELPHVSSIGIEGDIIEFELENEVEALPDSGDDNPVVLVAEYAGQIEVAVGKVINHEIVAGPEVFTRLSIKGSCVSFTI